jgi:hypothetical protein
LQAEVIMKKPIQNTNSFFPAFPDEVSVESKFKEKEIVEYFDSDLHDEDSVMMAEIYGGEFQKVWKKTHKKWWA